MIARRFSSLSQNARIVWAGALILVLTVSLAGIFGIFMRSQQNTPAPEPPRVVVQALATTPPSATPAPTNTAEPTPLPPTNTPEPTPVPLLPSPVLPTPEAVQPEPTATLVVVPEQSSPTRPPATAQAAKPDPNLLPSGARYGERKPNIPKRIVRIASPDIKLDTSVYEVYAPKNVWEVADYAGGHHFNSNNPGEGGNIVLSGHNNWHGEVFRYLEFLKPGNTIYVWTLDGTKYTYKVEELKKLKEAGVSMAQRLENAKVMDPTPAEQLTLITCWPYKTFTHRIIVIAKPAE